MNLLRQILAMVCLVAASSADAAERLTTKSKGVVLQSTNAELRPLQGTWEGLLVGDKARQKITVTIAGSSLHFHRDTNFWFKTTIALPADTNPKQLHATINEGVSSVGEVVVAIFKVEDGTLTLATGNGDGVAPKSFEVTADNGLSRYELRRIQPKGKEAEPSKTK